MKISKLVVTGVFCFMGLSLLQAQNKVIISPFTPSASEAKEIMNILNKYDERSYAIQVKNQGKNFAYGKLNPALVRGRTGVSLGSKGGQAAWFKTLLKEVAETTGSKMSMRDMQRLQAIGSKYRARTKIAIRPFSPSAADAKAIQSILGKANLNAYSIQVNSGGKRMTYGSMVPSRVRAGKGVSIVNAGGANAWVKTFLTEVAEEFKPGMDLNSVAKLQQIAAKYQ